MSTEVPEGWAKIDLRREVEFLSGCPFDSESFNQEQGYPLIRIRDLLNHKTETLFEGKFLDKYVIHKGDVLVGMDGDFNIVRWKGNQGLLNQRILRIRSKNEDVLDTTFFYYYIEPFLKKINARTGQTTVKHLSIYDFYPLELYRPKIEAQRRIAAILQNVDNDIDKTKELIEKHRKMKQGLMQDLCARGVDESGSLREEGIWDKLQIRSVAFVADIDHKMPEDVDFGVPFISSKDITEDGDIVLQGVKQISEKDYRRLARKIEPKKGDIIYSRIGTIGRVALVKRHVKFLMSYSCCVIRKKDKKIEPSYLAHVLRSQAIERQILKETQSIGVPDLGLDKIYDFEILLPRDRNEQQRIAGRLDALDLKIKAEQSYLSKLLKIKTGLMQDLLTGKVRVAA
jgi:type I restriction enzyme S subunit